MALTLSRIATKGQAISLLAYFVRDQIKHDKEEISYTLSFNAIIISLNIVVFHVLRGKQIRVVIFSVLKKLEYTSEASFNFSILIAISDNSTRGCGFDIISAILSTIPYLGFAEILVTFPNANPL
ncbi:8769_t:CDS:2 [Scutellospora calospora]|uniref:8769_t:CDS:1 n=1 Tax=Scutellospora calospora TaxID=85575 RepID=A0ACA9JZ14_9GLOM|nr:8769_t:CDS:2 [Scutellospora calospora]